MPECAQVCALHTWPHLTTLRKTETVDGRALNRRSARCCSLPTCQLLASWSSRTECHSTSSPMIRSSSSAWTASTPRRLSTGLLTAPPQFASGSCRTASNSTLTSQRWSFSAPLLSSGQLPTSPLSMLLEALCRLHRSTSRMAWPLIPTCSSTVTRETLQKPATSTLALCAHMAQLTDWRRRPDSRVQHRCFQAGLLQCTVEWRTGGVFR